MTQEPVLASVYLAMALVPPSVATVVTWISFSNVDFVSAKENFETFLRSESRTYAPAKSAVSVIS